MTAEQAFELMVRKIMKQLGGIGTGCRVCIGTVKEVDEKERTCVVERDGSPELNEVRLNAVIDEGVTDCFTVIPSVGSFVQVLLLDETEGLVVATSKIAKVMAKTGDVTMEVSAQGIVMNGGKLGGVIDIAKLTEKVNGLVDAFNGHTHTIASGAIATQGSATAQATVAPVTVPAVKRKAEKLDRGDYEDEVVKH